MYSSQHQAQPPMDSMAGNALDQGISGTINPAALSQSGTCEPRFEFFSCVAASVRSCRRAQGAHASTLYTSCELTVRFRRSVAHPDLAHQQQPQRHQAQSFARSVCAD